MLQNSHGIMLCLWFRTLLVEDPCKSRKIESQSPPDPATLQFSCRKWVWGASACLKKGLQRQRCQDWRFAESGINSWRFSSNFLRNELLALCGTFRKKTISVHFKTSISSLNLVLCFLRHIFSWHFETRLCYENSKAVKSTGKDSAAALQLLCNSATGQSQVSSPPKALLLPNQQNL